VKVLQAHEVDIIQQRLSLLATFCLDDEFNGLLERYLEQSRPQWNGTLDVILPHFMSIRDMRKAQGNLRYLCSMGQKLLEMRDLVKEQLRKETSSEVSA